jgi:WXG100 family type VII secretion target
MAFEGMDPDQVEQYGHQLLTESSNVEHLMQTIGSHVNSLAASWQGSDSEQFQHEWSGNYVRQMHNAARALHDLGQAALRNAEDQRRTSSGL